VNRFREKKVSCSISKKNFRITACASHTMLHEEEQANMQASHDIVRVPTVIPMGSELAAYLVSPNTQYILPLEHAYYSDLDAGPRFLATRGVFTCISVFAWAPSGRAFGAHIAIPQLHFACRRPLGRGGHILADITLALKATFKNERNLKDVRVHFVGGQEIQDNDQGLVNQFPGDCRKHSFAWHVIGSVQRAGLTADAESKRLLNVFPGIMFRPDFEQEQRKRAQSFCLVALDRQTGALLTHTLFEQEGSYEMACLGTRDQIEELRYRKSLHSEYAVVGRRSQRVVF